MMFCLVLAVFNGPSYLLTVHQLLTLVPSEHVPPVNVQIHMKVVLKNTVLRNTEYAGI